MTTYTLRETFIVDAQGNKHVYYECSCGEAAKDCGHWPAPGVDTEDDD